MSKRNISLKIEFVTDSAKVIPVTINNVKENLSSEQIKAFTDAALASNGIYTKDGSKIVSVKSQKSFDQASEEFDFA